MNQEAKFQANMYLENKPARPRALFLFAHGAGAPMDSEFMNAFSGGLCANDIAVVRFEFPYMGRRRLDGRKRPPDRAPQLLQCWREVIADHAGVLPLVIGGKSMGGRMATLIAAEQVPVRAVVCLGYPFHPPRRPERLRTEHFRHIQRPVLILQGERDPFGSRGEVASYGLPESVAVHWLPAGNHDWLPPKRAAFSAEDNMSMAVDQATAFILKHATPVATGQ